MPFFSVIVPAYNRVELLACMLRSVQEQTFTNYEVIVVDDGSTDGTREWLAKQNGNVRVLTQKNRGPGAARNLGLQHATGEYAAFLDSDDGWFPWTLQTYHCVIARAGNPAFVVGKPFRFRNSSDLNSAVKADTEFRKFSDYFSSGDRWRWWGVSSFVITLEAVRSVRGFVEDNINGEDGDLALRLGVARGFVQITSPYTFAYREHEANLTRDLERTVAGVWHKVRSEKGGCYPGGERRARERWQILTRHVRPVALECLRAGMKREAWKLYRATLGWHLELRQWKFLVGFPVRFCVAR